VEGLAIATQRCQLYLLPVDSQGRDLSSLYPVVRASARGDFFKRDFTQRRLTHGEWWYATGGQIYQFSVLYGCFENGNSLEDFIFKACEKVIPYEAKKLCLPLRIYLSGEGVSYEDSYRQIMPGVKKCLDSRLPGTFEEITFFAVGQTLPAGVGKFFGRIFDNQV